MSKEKTETRPKSSGLKSRIGTEMYGKASMVGQA